MTPAVPGLHHVTAIASDPQANVAFHTDVLGLRLIKRTVNFDDPSTYHLYYGDEIGTPGTVMTFFPFGNGRSGTVGRGQASATAYTVPEGSLDYWQDRLADHGVETGDVIERFDEQVLPFWDADGQPYELVTGESNIDPWEGGPVPADHSIRGFHGVTLDSLSPEETGTVLETMGYDRVGTEQLATEDGERIRYRSGGSRAVVVDVLDRPEGSRGVQGIGTVHHVAFRTADDDSQAHWQEQFRTDGFDVTEQKDRQYFRSIYFREAGGVLFEIATDEPGFTRDEDVDELGEALKLPPWLEGKRDRLETQLPPLSVEGVN